MRGPPAGPNPWARDRVHSREPHETGATYVSGDTVLYDGVCHGRGPINYLICCISVQTGGRAIAADLLICYFR